MSAGYSIQIHILQADMDSYFSLFFSWKCDLVDAVADIFSVQHDIFINFCAEDAGG